MRIGTPEIVVGGTLVALVAIGIAFGTRGDQPLDPADAVLAQVTPIAHRVEAIRGVRFRRVPRPVLVTPAQTRDLQLRDLDRTYPAARRSADEHVVETLGLVPHGTDLRKVLGDVSGEQVAGFYDTRRKRLAVVDGPVASNSVLTEITLAHELDHALDDQRFGLRDDTAGTDDRTSAYTALIEGTATAVMDEYARRYIPPGSALLSVFSAVGPKTPIPPYLQRSLEFSYTGGERFVSALRDADGGRWALVNRALAKRPPDSTEQVMHPEKYLRRERPLPVRIGPLGLGAGWKRTSAGAIGEFDTRELLKLGTDPATAATAAAGWGGARYEQWENGAARVLVLRWRWDTPGDAREFDAALPLYLLKGLKASAAGPARWTVRDPGGAAIDVSGGVTTLAFAPSPEQAAALAAQRR
jgi:hypothetical protein